MNEEDMYRMLMLAAASLAIISALGAVVLLVMTVTSGMLLIIPTILLAAFTIGCGVAATYFGQRYSGNEKIFSNVIEQEVLTRKQRRELKNARGGLVMDRALVEIDHERDNIVHNRQLELDDPNKPPHKTRFGETT